MLVVWLLVGLVAYVTALAIGLLAEWLGRQLGRPRPTPPGFDVVTLSEQKTEKRG